MQRVALLASFLLFAGLAVFFYQGTGHAPPPPSPTSDAPSSPSPWDESWWPLARKTLWRYQVLGKGPFRTRGYYVQETGGEKGALVLENTDGKQSDNFRVRSGPGDRVEFREFQAGQGSIQYLPESLEEGTRWQLSKKLRAVAAAFEEVEIPCLGGRREALRIEYEAHYGPDQTQEPGWYPAGTRWMVRGVGLVQEDLDGSEAPPELRDLVYQQRRLMQLSEFQAPWR